MQMPKAICTRSVINENLITKEKTQVAQGAAAPVLPVHPSRCVLDKRYVLTGGSSESSASLAEDNPIAGIHWETEKEKALPNIVEAKKIARYFSKFQLRSS